MHAREEDENHAHRRTSVEEVLNSGDPARRPEVLEQATKLACAAAIEGDESCLRALAELGVGASLSVNREGFTGPVQVCPGCTPSANDRGELLERLESAELHGRVSHENARQLASDISSRVIPVEVARQVAQDLLNGARPIAKHSLGMLGCV